MPVTALFAIIGGLALAGVPGLSGGAPKVMVLEAASAVPLLTPILLASAVITAIYVFRFLYLIFFRAVPKGCSSGDDAPLPMLVAMGSAALTTIEIGIFPSLLTDLLAGGGPWVSQQTGAGIDQQISSRGGTMGHPFALRQLIESGGILITAALPILLLRPLRMPGQGWEADVDRLYSAMGRVITWISADPLSHGAQRDQQENQLARHASENGIRQSGCCMPYSMEDFCPPISGHSRIQQRYRGTKNL